MCCENDMCFRHPMGELIVTVGDKTGVISRIRFKPSESIDIDKVKALDWSFIDGDGRCTGWGIALQKE